MFVFHCAHGMTTLLDVPFTDGGSVLVEIDDRGARPVTRSGRQTDAIVRAEQTFEEAIDRVAPAFNALVTRLRDVAERPEVVEIEFGLKLNTEVGAIIARTGAEANFRVLV